MPADVRRPRRAPRGAARRRGAAAAPRARVRAPARRPPRALRRRSALAGVVVPPGPRRSGAARVARGAFDADRRPAGRDQRRPLPRARAAAPPGRPHVRAPRMHGRGRGLPALSERRAVPEVRGRDGAALRGARGGARPDGRDRRARGGLLARRPALRVSRRGVPAGHDADRAPARADRGRGGRALSRGRARGGHPAARARTRDDRGAPLRGRTS